ncbi:hypothetical protein HDU82_001226, partial [Entophlyctis luteolus]
QLSEGLTIIQEAFDRRTAALQSELLESKQDSLSQREYVCPVNLVCDAPSIPEAYPHRIPPPQIASLESKWHTLQQRNAELESTVQNQSLEIKSLSETKQLLIEKYNILKKSAQQLDSFRKNIVSMVEYGPIMASTFTGTDFNQSFTVNDRTDLETEILSPSRLNSRFSQNYELSGRTIQKPNDTLISPRQETVTEAFQSATNHSKPTSSSQHGNFISMIEGPSFFNSHDLKSFEMNSQVLDYSLALPLSNQQATEPKENPAKPKASPDRQKSPTPARQFNNAALSQNSAFNSSYSSHSTPNLYNKVNSGESNGADSGFRITRKPPLPDENSKKVDTNSRSILQSVEIRQSPPVQSVTTAPSGKQLESAFQPQSLRAATEKTGAAVADAGVDGGKTGPVDAPTLYKQIRAALTHGEFEAFAGYVAAFNAGTAGAEDTVKNIRRVVRDARLFGRMRTLIYTALAESARDSAAAQ